jgi:hypothetical protein
MLGISWTAIALAIVMGIVLPAVVAILVSGLDANGYLTKGLRFARRLPTSTKISVAGIAAVSFAIAVTAWASSGSSKSPPVTPQPTISAATGLNPCNEYGASYAIDRGQLKPGLQITGPAAIHPIDGSLELSQELNIEWIPSWGLDVPHGRSVTLPNSVTLISGASYTPSGSYDVYLTDSDLKTSHELWLENRC